MSVLLMTATIMPPDDAPHLRRKDPAVRLEDYRRALQFYARSRSIDAIVFVDNSASDLSILQTAAKDAKNKELEFISFGGLNYPPAYGRAYGELTLIDYAIAHSRIFAGLGTREQFWKVTGRLIVENIDRLVASSPTEADFYCDLRRYPRGWQELRVFACTFRGFHTYLRAHLEGVRHDLIESRGYTAPEQWLYDVNCSHSKAVGFVPRFRTQPVFAGHSGTFQVDYGSKKKRIGYKLKALSRTTVPWLWI